MVHIKTTLCAESNCGLTINNVTGYYDAVNNSNGFLTTQTPTELKGYKLDDVYQFTYLIKNNWNGTFTNIAIAGNIGKKVTYNVNKSYNTLMEEGLVNQAYTFTEDGYYSVYQFAIPKESIKNTVSSLTTYTYYVEESTLNVYVMFDGVSTLVNLFDVLISCTTDWSHNNIVLLRSNMVSKCFLESCFSAILEIFSKYYTDPLCIRNNQSLQSLREQRDLLFAITNTIQYYVELGQYYQAAKLIYDASYCNLCKDYLVAAPTGCNCS